MRERERGDDPLLLNPSVHPESRRSVGRNDSISSIATQLLVSVRPSPKKRNMIQAVNSSPRQDCAVPTLPNLSVHPPGRDEDDQAAVTIQRGRELEATAMEFVQ